MFDKRQDKEKIRNDMASLAKSEQPGVGTTMAAGTANTYKIEKGLLEQLKDARQKKIDTIIKLNEELTVLDGEIAYLETHPAAENVMRHFLRNHPDDADIT